MKVKDAMHPGATWVQPDTSIIVIAKMMKEQDIGAVPVGENDRLIGMVTDRDIICRGLAGNQDCTTLTARDVMSKPIIYCRADEFLEDALHIMEKNQIRRLPVVDDNKRLVGMLAIGDITQIGGRELAGEVMRSVAEHHA